MPGTGYLYCLGLYGSPWWTAGSLLSSSLLGVRNYKSLKMWLLRSVTWWVKVRIFVSTHMYKWGSGDADFAIKYWIVFVCFFLRSLQLCSHLLGMQRCRRTLLLLVERALLSSNQSCWKTYEPWAEPLTRPRTSPDASSSSAGMDLLLTDDQWCVFVFFSK